MKFPWSKKRKADRELAEAALKKSAEQLEAVRRRAPEVNWLANRLEYLGDKNHFAESLNMQARGKP